MSTVTTIISRSFIQPIIRNYAENRKIAMGIILYLFGDFITTYVNLAYTPAEESNIVMEHVIATFGFTGLLMVKIFVIIPSVIIHYETLVKTKYEWVIPNTLFYLGIFVMVINSLNILIYILLIR